jgi:hypothetical protein
MWTLAGVRPVFGAARTSPVRPPLPHDRQILIDGLDCLDSSEQVREAIEALGVRADVQCGVSRSFPDDSCRPN